MRSTRATPRVWPGADTEEPILLEIAAAYGDLPGVVAVAVAGSIAAGSADPASDFDLYVYAPELPPIPLRAAVADRFAVESEIGNSVWEQGDEWRHRSTGRHVDVMYRTPAWIEDQLARVLVHHEAAAGYSTCFWHNVLHSAALVDASGWYRQLQEQAHQPYPEALKRAIIAKNYPVLRQAFSSYLHQIERAVTRDDAVSVQHRTTALLASYFDILFAVNEIPHPGEKHQLHQILARGSKLPPDMETALINVLSVPAATATRAAVDCAATLVDGLDRLLAAEGLLPSRAIP